MPSHSPKEVVKIVDRMEMDRSSLHGVMDSDMDRYHLETYGGELDANGEDTLAGYRKFTANDPATVMVLAQHLGSTSKLIIRVQKPRAQDEEREINSLKEIFCLGILASADARRAKLHMPTLLDSLFSQSYFRGRVSVRVLLVKEPVFDQVPPEIMEQLQQNPELLDELVQVGVIPTRTYVDISDWDPRNVYFAMGKHGMSWANEKSYKSRQQLIEEYNVDPATVEGQENQAPFSEDDHEKDLAVYDWFDAVNNQIIIESREELKKSTPHGMGIVPVAFAYADLRPRFQAGKDQNYENQYGRGLFANDRAIFDEANFQYSVLKEITSRSIKQGLLVMSRDGTLELPEDPRVSGQETQLSTANEEAVLPMPPMEMVKEYSAFIGIISGMMQRGSFPGSAFGELAFQLSGFAITQLSQGIQAPLTSHIKAVESVMKQTLDILADAYSSGQFDVMELSGRLNDTGRTNFSQSIDPQLVAAGGVIEVEIKAQLPHDDVTRVQLMTMLRDASTGKPLADDRFLRDLMEFQDPEQMERAVWEQIGREGTPMAIAWNSYKAMLDQGDEDNAGIWEDELIRLAMMKWLETMQLAIIGGGETGPNMPGQNGTSPRARAASPSPNVAPPETVGIQSEPIQQAGALQAPGAPRPGARFGEQGFSPFADS